MSIKWPPLRCWTSINRFLKLFITERKIGFVISLISSLMFFFKLVIVFGLLLYTFPFKYPQRKKSRGRGLDCVVARRCHLPERSVFAGTSSCRALKSPSSYWRAPRRAETRCFCCIPWTSVAPWRSIPPAYLGRRPGWLWLFFRRSPQRRKVRWCPRRPVQPTQWLSRDEGWFLWSHVDSPPRSSYNFVCSRPPSSGNSLVAEYDVVERWEQFQHFVGKFRSRRIVSW